MHLTGMRSTTGIKSNSQKISMTKKEFDIFYLLAVNKGRVLAYGQIYQSVRNGYATGGERTAVVYHIRNIQKSLAIFLPFLYSALGNWDTVWKWKQKNYNES